MAVPEGLPLLVTLSLAFSIGKLKDKNGLIRDISGIL
jgi:magnesium-transporting ATPase (P-type)